MNDKSFNTALLLAILVTLAAVFGHPFFPKKHISIWPNPQIGSFFYSSDPSAAFWLDEQANQWRCVYPEIEIGEHFICSFVVLLEQAPNQGLDLSSYSHLHLKLKHTGSANWIRLYIRNFDPAYSTEEDVNSTKFNAINFHIQELKQELQIKLDEFNVAEWWLRDYSIPRKLAASDLHNAVTLGIEYAEGTGAGNQDIQIEKVEFVGEWINAENWYLLILACWMLGILIYAITKLIQLHQQTRHDVMVINELNSNNEQLKLETDKFRRLSTVDPLTQAYNRFGIDQIVATLTAFSKDKSEQQNSPDFALMIIDIDHFKRINDRRGHDTGDRVLQNIAAITSKCINAKDFLGRWGGEEFIVIMPHTRKEFALALAEKIRLTIHDTVFEPDDPLSITASFGVSEKLADEDFATTFKRADIALYEAKAKGRNCSVLAKDQLPSNV